MKKSELAFIEYVTRELSMENVIQLYRSYNIIPERIELYLDFVGALNNIVFKTYPGADVMTDSISNAHFNWCWEKTIDSFNKEGVGFKKEDKILRKYLWDYLHENFYNIEGEIRKESLAAHWEQILTYSNVKTRSDIDTMVEIYRLFERNLFGKIS